MSDTPTTDVPTADPSPEASSAVAVADPPAAVPATPAAPAAPAVEAPAAAPPAVPPVAEAPTPAATPSGGHRKVAVPMWLVAVLGVVVIAVGAFFVGRSTAPETSGPKTLADAVEQTARGDLEVGDFNAQDLISALQQNGDLNLGGILDILGGLSNNR